MKQPLAFLLLLLLISCNKKDTESFESIVGVWHFNEVITNPGIDLTEQYDSTRLEIDAKEIRFYKTFVTPNGVVDSLIADGIYDLYWGMVEEHPDPAYPDSVIQVQYQMVSFAWATAPPYPYTNTFSGWHLVKKEPGELHMRDSWKVNYHLLP